MPYLVKPPNGPARRMELAEIRAAVQNCAIGTDWLVKDLRQQGSSTVGQLLGELATEAITVTCPQCHAPIPARQVDAGRAVRCPKCQGRVAAVDDAEVERHRGEIELLHALRGRAVFGVVSLILGTTITVGSFLVSDQSGFVVFCWGAVLFGIATFARTFPAYLRLKRKLGPLADRLERTPRPQPSRRPELRKR